MKEIELIGKRKAREKHFLKENGIITANVYDEDIHFLKDGKYEEIDNTLVEENGYLVNKNNAYKVYFSKKSKDELMEIGIGNNYIKTRLVYQKEVDIKENITQSKLHKNVCYPDIIDNVDLEYNVMPGKVKEAIILKNKNVDLERLVFLIETNTKLELKENKKIISTMDNNNCFEFDAPYMVDVNFKTNNNINYKLTKIDDDIYQLELIIDKEWLNNEETTYPVIIDPTVTNSGQDNSVYDTQISPGDDNEDWHGTAERLRVGMIETTNGYQPIRALFKFALPTIGTGSQIINATLNLVGYPEDRLPFNSDMLTIHRVTADWTEASARWSNLNDKYDSKVEGIMEARCSYFESENVIKPVINGSDITRLVRKWYTGTPNYGVMLKQNEEKYNPDFIAQFFSKDNNVTGADPKPLLSISYRNQNGILNYMDYQEHDFLIGSAYVNNYNGNLTTIFDIGSSVGGKMPVDLNLVYNTNDVVLGNNYGYGLGYKLNLHQMIKEQSIDGKTYLEYCDKDGTLHYFLNQKVTFDNNGYNTSDTGNVYYDEDGLDMTITKNSNDYVLKDKNGNTMKFIKNDDIAYLSEIEDVSGNKNTIIYNSNNLITKIVDANNSEINISYENNLTTIVSPYETVKLNYSNNKLISISSLLGTTYFEYNSNNLISVIEDIDDIKVSYEYYEQTPYKVKKVSQYGAENTLGEYFEVIYGFDSTTITDSKNNAKNIIFNSQGSVVSVSGLKNKDDINNAYGVSQINGTNDGTNPGYNNKLLRAEIPLKYVKNLLSNTSFEENKIYFNCNPYTTLSITNEEALTGVKSLKVVSTLYNDQIITYGGVDLQVDKGDYYTFSAYVKNTNKIRLLLSYSNIDGENIEVESEMINSSDDFERHDVTIFYPEDATSNLHVKLHVEEVGTAYIDDIQLESGEVANNYNLLENSDFSNGFSDWALSVRDVNTGNNISTTDRFELVTLSDGTKALKTKMNPIYSISMEKIFNIIGKGGDVFNISFWYKNHGIDSNLSMHYGSRVYIVFNYVDSEVNGSCMLTSPLLNINDEAWQYVSNDFTAEKDYTSIKLLISHEYTANDFYITNMSLFKNIRNIYYEYDEFGNVILENNLDNNTNNFNYDKNNQLIVMTNPKGKNFSFEYDNIITDRVINGISDMGISNKYTYDTNDNVTSTKIIKDNINGNITNGSYKIRLKGTDKYLRNISNEIKIINEECNHDLWTLEKEGDYFKISHSIIIDRCFTVQGNKLLLTNYNNDNSLFELKKNKNGSYLIKLKLEDKYLKFNDNSQIEITELIEDDYHFQVYFETLDSSLFIENKATYTDDGKFIKSTTDSLGNVVLYDIDEVTGLIKSETNSKGNVTSYTYDAKKTLVKTSCGNKNVEYSYNDKNLLNIVKYGTKEYNFTYDEFSNVKTIKIGDNITLVTNHYDSSGNLTSFDYGNNVSLYYEYDEFYRLKKITKENDTYKYKYGSNGDLVKVLSNNDTTKYTYDLSKRLSEYKFNDFKIKYKYDVNDNIIENKYSLNGLNNVVTNTFNDDDLVTNTQFEDKKIDYNYDLLGRLIKSKINHTYEINYEYLSNGKNTSLLIKSLKLGNDKYSYKYDKLSNITHIYNNDKLINKYYYDDYNQLVKEIDYEENKLIEYKYDNVGNILFRKMYNLKDCSFINQDIYKYNNNDWEDQLTYFNNELITYDAIGNPLTIGNNVSLSWTNGRELNSYNDGVNFVTFKYNTDAIRLSKTINGVETKYYLEGSDVVFEKTGNDMLYFMRDAMGVLFGLKYNDNVYYYIKNVQNDIIGILDSNYNVVARYKYDSWGKIISITDTNGNDISNNISHIANINPYRYRSYYYDKETKLYYLNERYYNPAWRRFINSDSYNGRIGGNILYHNIYAYTLNNPIMNYDKNGNAALAVALITAGWTAIKGAIISLAGTAFKATSITVAGIAVSKVATSAASKYKTEEKTASKTKAKTKSPNSSKHNDKPCVVAYKGTIEDHVLVTNHRMTINESADYVIAGGNVMCDTKTSAKKVAKRANDLKKGLIYHDAHSNGKIGYYPHFHYYDKNIDAHIWFYPLY